MAQVNKISSFKSFTEIKNQEATMKLREENNAKRQETVGKIGAILDEMGLTSLSELDEDRKQALISKMFGNVSEDEAEDIEDEINKLGEPKKLEERNAFLGARAKAIEEEKTEFEFNGKIYKVTVNEGNAFGDAVRKAKEAGEKEFEFDGKTYKVEEGNAFGDAVRKAKEAGEKEFEFDGKTYKVEEAFVFEGKHGMAKRLLQNIINGDTTEAEGIKMSKEMAEHYLYWISTSPYGTKNSNLPLYMLVNASFNWGIERSLPSSLKKELAELKDSTKKNESLVVEARSIAKIQNEWSKVTTEMAALAAEWKVAEGDAKTALLAQMKEKTAVKKGLESELDAAVAGKDKDLELVVSEMVVTEGAVKQFDADFNDMVRNIKAGYGWIDPEYVADTWENSSDSIDFELVKGEIYKRLIAAKLLAYADDEDEESAGQYIKSLKELGIKESVVNEAEIKSDDEFKEYAMTILKKAFGADFDEAKAGEVADGILKKCDGDYGAAVGMLTSSLGESVVTEGFDANYWEDYHEAAGKIENPSGMQVQQEVSACVEEWNDNNENGEENEVTPNGEKKVLKLAKEFVKAKGWISSDVIEAMIAQES
jgi:hypothetical protein